MCYFRPVEDDNNHNEVNDSAETYSSLNQRRITFFKSFEEAELHGLKEMASHSYETRLANLELLRRRFLFPDTEPVLQRVITIIKGKPL